jgi:acetylornithine deacetylase/succinyl-diaminopimelate desuccinylase-like protein
MRRPALALLLLSLAAAPLAAKPKAAAGQAQAQALDLAKRLLAIRSVRGPGNKTAETMQLARQELLAGGWPDSAIELVPLDDTAYLIATWPGSDPGLKPLVISGHMDVVEAKPSDWERDPFTPVVENGFLFGRGASDMKLDNALGLTALIELRRKGYRPRRTIVVAFSGDEETTMATSQVIAKRLAKADLVLNLDYDLNGVLDAKSGKPLYYSWQGAEKSYGDFELSVTNPGGHSSQPRADNAINQLAGALVRIGQYRFPAEASALTQAYFAQAAKLESDPALARAMREFAANPADPQAIAALQGDVEASSLVGTTCVVTLIAGGHAVNALPQRATANVNCRIFPGHSRAEVMEELRKVAAEPALTIRDVSEGVTESPASRLRGDFTGAIGRAVAKIHPGLPVVPGMSKGASDCMWYRAGGTDCYIVSALFLKPDDYRSHGLNERAPVASIAPAITFYISLFSDLSK